MDEEQQSTKPSVSKTLVDSKKAVIEIVIVKFNCEEVEIPCIQSVLANTSGNYHLTIYDNYPSNKNIGKLWNHIIKRSDAEYICLLNSDTIVYENWLDKLLETFKKVENVGCVGPATDNSHNSQSGILLDETFVDFSTYDREVLSGFCLVFPRKIWAEVGGFPEDYGFYGQEVNFIDRIVEEGYKQIWRTDVFVHHEGSASVKKAEERGEIDEKKERAIANKRRNK